MSKRAALVLDFDNTLTLELVDGDFGFDVDEVFGDSRRIESLKDFLSNASELADLYILSGNEASVIKDAMTQAGFPLLKLFRPGRIHGGHRRDKWRHLNDYPEQYEVVVFVDDHPDSFVGVSNKIVQIQVERPLDDLYMEIILDELRGIDTQKTPPKKQAVPSYMFETPPKKSTFTPGSKRME